MKTSQKAKHLGQSIALGAVLVGASLGIFVLMIVESGGLR